MSAEQLAQRTLDLDLITERQLQEVWGSLGSSNVEAEDLQQAMLRQGLLTNYQFERMMAGERAGFFYGDYKVLYLVGTGTFARVYRAAHRKTNKLAAVKVLRNKFSDDPTETDRFYREGQMGQSLKHPNIVPILEVHSDRRTHYIVMDFVEGRNLREFMKTRKVCEPVEATRLMIDIASGLSYAFQKGISHRDLKMTNVLVSSRGQAKLVDFGLAGDEAQLSDEALAKLSNPRTIDYAGLERSTGVRRDDSRSDIFFAGCIYYHLLTGQAPLVETRDRTQRLSKSRFREIKPILEVNSSLPMGVALIVNRALEFDPEKRYQTPAELVADLQTMMVRLRVAGDGAATGSAVEDLQSREGLDENGSPRAVMIVESEVKVQNVFRDLLKKNGYRVLVTIDPHRAMSRFNDNPEVAQLVMFSATSIGAPALEAFNKFSENPLTREIPSVLLLHKRQVAWEAKATTDERHRVLTMPVKRREIRNLLVELISGQQQQTAGE
ncbi:MAG: serine/threonine-protein kinase [Pirellulales bacterium]